MFIYDIIIICCLLVFIVLNIIYRQYMKTHYILNRYHFNFISVQYKNDKNIIENCKLLYTNRFYLEILEYVLKILYRDHSIEAHKLDSVIVKFQINKNKRYTSITIEGYENKTLLEAKDLSYDDILVFDAYLSRLILHNKSLLENEGTIIIKAETDYDGKTI